MRKFILGDLRLKGINMVQKTKVLCVCARGMNRSQYLAKYLRRKGYSTRAGGSQPFKDPNKPWNPISQEDVNWAEVIIVMEKWILQIIKKNFKIKNKKIIQLEVIDVPRLVPEEFKHLRELDKKEFNKRWSYPQLRKSIKPRLPLKT